MPKSILFTANGITYTNSEDSELNLFGLIIDNTYLKLPSGNTAQRPISAETGMLRFNSETNEVEGYNGNIWINLRS